MLGGHGRVLQSTAAARMNIHKTQTEPRDYTPDGNRGRSSGVGRTTEPVPEAVPVSRLTLSFIAAILLVLATAGAALAKCPPGSAEEQCQGVVANIDMTGTLRAGTSTEVGFWIHEGGEPVRVASVDLTFARVADATVLRFEATPSGLTADTRPRSSSPPAAAGRWRSRAARWRAARSACHWKRFG